MPKDLAERRAIVETRVEERHAESMRRMGDVDASMKAGFATLGAKLDEVHRMLDANDRQLTTLQAENAENRRSISRLWKLGTGVGAGITGAAAALAKWWS